MNKKYKVHNAYAVSAADHLITLKRTKPVWDVIREIFNVWAKSKPEQYRSYIIEYERMKSNRKITSVGRSRFSGVSRDSNGNNLIYLVDMPEWVMTAIRALYNADELPMDKAFMERFAREFPKLKVIEKV